MWILVIIFIILLLFIPFDINIKFKRVNNNVSFKIILLLFAGVLKLGVDIPALKLINENKDVLLNLRSEIGSKNKKKNMFPKKKKISVKRLISKAQKMYKNHKKFKTASKYLSKKIKIKKLVWTTEVGLGDAALNGLTCGCLWIIKSLILSSLLNNKEYEEIDVNVIPNYIENTLNINFDCIIKLKLVYIINAGIYGLKAMIKGGE